MAGKRPRRAPLTLFLAILWLGLGELCSMVAWAGESGQIRGTLRRDEGGGLGGASVVLNETGAATITDAEGGFAFDSVPAGLYSLAFALGEETAVASDVEVLAGESTQVEEVVDWSISFASTITVYSASRRRERIVDAPAAITSISEKEIGLESASGQIPKLLEFTVGVEATQSGVYDYNLNTRGFNNLLTRRVQTLVDGRDTTSPVTGSQEWYTIGFLLEDITSVELVRGPSGALYGPNTFNGVLNIVTNPPHLSQGGKVRLTAGDLDTRTGEARWAGELGDDWYFKLMGTHSRSDNFTRSRNVEVEYDGLALEPVPLLTDEVQVEAGMLRLDKNFASGNLLSLEAGLADGGGETLLGAATRFQITNIKREWARVNYSTPRWNALGYYNRRDGDNQLGLGSGALIFNDDDNFQIEIQGNKELSRGKYRVVGGVSYREENLDSLNPLGVQTLIPEPNHADKQAVFGQFEAELSDRLKLVAAARWDESSLHDAQFSPKAHLVYGLAPNHTLRLGYNEAFQVGNGLELFLDIPAGLPLDLSAVETDLAPILGGIPLGLGSIPIRALGNRDLDVEQIRSFELGYSGILGPRAFLTVDYYQNRQEQFITDLLPGANPNLGPYQAPAGLSPDGAATVEALLNGLLPGLTNDPVTGAPLWAFSFGNTAKVDSEGVEIALAFEIDRQWAFDVNYSWFDFEIKEQILGPAISPNAPENKFAASLTYSGKRFLAALRYRWVDDFDWASGVFAGPVPSYDTVNLSGNYRLSEDWEVGVNVNNLFDNVHYEAFGGDLLERRALGYVAYSW